MTTFSTQYWWLVCRGDKAKWEKIRYSLSNPFLVAFEGFSASSTESLLCLILLRLTQILYPKLFFSDTHQWVPKTCKQQICTTGLWSTFSNYTVTILELFLLLWATKRTSEAFVPMLGPPLIGFHSHRYNLVLNILFPISETQLHLVANSWASFLISVLLLNYLHLCHHRLNPLRRNGAWPMVCQVSSFSSKNCRAAIPRYLLTSSTDIEQEFQKPKAQVRLGKSRICDLKTSTQSIERAEGRAIFSDVTAAHLSLDSSFRPLTTIVEKKNLKV